MADDTGFIQLIERLRRRDQEASTSLVQQVLPNIRKIVAQKINSLGMQHKLDAEDVCQMVLANFFIRLADGQFTLDEPEHLAKLLGKLARNQVLDEVRKLLAVRRGSNPSEALDPHDEFERVAGHEPTPSRIVAGHELLEAMYNRLTPDERILADRRAKGLDWPDIAAEVGGTPEALRKKLARAYDRVVRQLNLDDRPSI